MGSSFKRVLKFVGYPLFFLVTFVVFLLWTFPLDRFTPMVEGQLSGLLDRKVDIEEMSLSLTGNLVLSMVEIEVPMEAKTEALSSFADDAEDDEEDEDGDEGKEKKPEGPKAPDPTYLIEEAVVSVGLFDLLFDTLSLDVEMDALGGQIELAYSGPMPGEEMDEDNAKRKLAERRKARASRRRVARKGDAPQEAEAPEEEVEDEDEVEAHPLSFSLLARGIKLARVHDLQEKSPLPLSGDLDLTVELKSKTGAFSDSEGAISLVASGVSLGNGRTKIEVGGLPMSIDEIRIEEVGFDLVVTAGQGKVERFKMSSQDFDASVEGTVTLSDPLSRSRLDLYLMFKFLEGYEAKSASSKTLISNLDTFSSDLKNAHRTDGYYGFRYRGLFGTARMTPSKRNITGKGAKADRKKPGRKAASRPRKNPRPQKAGGDETEDEKGSRGLTGGQDPREMGQDGRPDVPQMDAIRDMKRPEVPLAADRGRPGAREVKDDVEEEVEEEEVEEVVEETEEGEEQEEPVDEGAEEGQGSDEEE